MRNVDTEKMEKQIGPSRILLIMPPDIAPAFQPHLGLGIIAGILENDGHNVLVVDYSYLAFRSRTLPKIDAIMETFSPDVIGVSLFSQHLHLSRQFIESLHRKRPTTPIVIGGPHVSLGSENVIDEVLNWPGVSTVVRGEVEKDIVGIFNNLLHGRCEPVVNCTPVKMTDYCRPNFGLFMGGTDLETYPIQLSRGCPYKCVFCNIERLAGRRFRKRSISDCIDEIKHASREYKKLKYIKVVDDAPNCNAQRFEDFIEHYIAEGFKAQLEVMQLRADHLTLRSCELLKKAGQPSICIGVESADPAILAGVDKGENLEHIMNACRHVKAVDLPLVLCFVLGLPEATVETDLRSVQFAQKIQPVHCYWNLAQPMPGTKMYDYFLANGTIYASNAFKESSLKGGCFADTPEYSNIDRLKMQLIAQASTNELTLKSVPYYLYKSVQLFIFWRMIKSLASKRPTIHKNIPRRW